MFLLVLTFLPTYLKTWNCWLNLMLFWATAWQVHLPHKWKELPAQVATWEPYILMQNQFPYFHLEDKVTLGTMGIDKPPMGERSACRI